MAPPKAMVAPAAWPAAVVSICVVVAPAPARSAVAPLCAKLPPAVVMPTPPPICSATSVKLTAPSGVVAPMLASSVIVPPAPASTVKD